VNALAVVETAVPPGTLWVPLYTIMPPEVVMAGSQQPRELAESRSGNRLALVHADGRLERLISTDPADFLLPHLQPGQLLSW
jgi:hypothetical protein